MRIDSIRLENFRGVEDSGVIEFGPGVTVVEGPNEVGKSSLAEALRLLRLAKATSKAQQVRDIQPVGRDVGPEVTIEVGTGPYRLTYRKRWLVRPVSELHVIAPRPEDLSGDAAHDRFQEILQETLDTTLLEALDVQQGQSLDQARLADVRALRLTLDRAQGPAGAPSSMAVDDDPDSGGALAGGGDHDALMEAVERAYRAFFTPRDGRPTGAYQASIAQLAAAQEDLGALEDSGRELDGWIDEHRDLTERLAEVESKLARAQSEEQRRTAADQELARLREAAERSDRELARVRQTLDRATEAAERRREQIRAVQSRVDASTDLEEEIARAQQALTPAQQAFDQAVRDVERARSRREAAHAAATRADRALALDRDRREHRDLAAHVARARAARARLVQAQADLDATPDIGERAVERLAALHTDLAIAQRTRDLASAQVTVEALGEAPVLVDGRNVEPGQELTSPVREPMEIRVPGVARIAVAPGTTGTDLDQAVDDAREKLSRALEEAGVDTLDAARDAAERRRAATDAREEAQKDLDREIRDHGLEEMERRLAGLAAAEEAAGRAGRVDPAEEDAGAPSSMAADAAADTAAVMTAPGKSEAGAEDHLRDAAVEAEERPREAAAPTPTAAQDLHEAAAGARADEEEAIRGLAHAERVLERARTVRETRSAALITAQARVDAAREEQARATADLEAARAGLDDASVDQAVRDAAEAHDARQAQAAIDRSALDDADPETVAALLENARLRVAGARDERDQVVTRITQVKALIDDRAADGLETRRAEAAGRLEEARTRADRMNRDARAARLLRDTMVRHRDRARQRYVEPFTDRIQRLGKMVFGADFQVQVTPDLRIGSRTLRGRTVPFDSLSAGTREQLSLIGRLACAQLVSGSDGAPVILDDTLGFSDPERLERLGAVLGTVGTSAQVIVLTCQPGRFEAVGGARVIRLGKPPDAKFAQPGA